MKHYTFYDESDKFDELLKDLQVKKSIKTKIHWNQHLILGFEDDNDKLFGYIVLKYGDNIINPINKDYTPIPGIDYIPKKD